MLTKARRFHQVLTATACRAVRSVCSERFEMRIKTAENNKPVIRALL